MYEINLNILISQYFIAYINSGSEQKSIRLKQMALSTTTVVARFSATAFTAFVYFVSESASIDSSLLFQKFAFRTEIFPSQF